MDKKPILIIEDDQSLVSLIENALDPAKFNVYLALDANEGFAKALQEQPAIVILDILLPGEDGFECLKKLKEHPKTKDIPVIILSNLGQENEIRRGLGLGAVDYLLKADLSINDIIKKILQYLV
jgi:DNA-binding response OmpR family regulator